MSASMYGPNSEQLVAYLAKVAHLDADDWASLARALGDTPRPRYADVKAIETAQVRAGDHGVGSEVEAAAREARRSIEATLEANSGWQSAWSRARARIDADDPNGGGAEQDITVAAMRAAAIAGATLLVLRPLLTDDEFYRAWPMPILDPRCLPRHVHVPTIGAAG